jgi:hypothetical protein
MLGVSLTIPLWLAALWSILWAPAIVLALISVYLLVWGTVGGGRWCRGCKRFDGV